MIANMMAGPAGGGIEFTLIRRRETKYRRSNEKSNIFFLACCGSLIVQITKGKQSPKLPLVILPGSCYYPFQEDGRPGSWVRRNIIFPAFRTRPCWVVGKKTGQRGLHGFPDQFIPRFEGLIQVIRDGPVDVAGPDLW